MSIIKKCDRCGVTYELYNVRSSGGKTERIRVCEHR